MQAAANELPNKKARLTGSQQELQTASLSEAAASPLVDASSPCKHRLQKALKQTNIKNLSFNSKYVRRRLAGNQYSHYADSPQVPKSPEIISTLLAGNITFNYNKNQFKCVECGDSDLKTHFK